MPRQPYSVAVLSTRGRLHPRFLRFLSPGNGGTEGGVKTIERGLGRKWSSPCRRDGEVEKTPSLTVRKVSVPCKGNRKGRKDY